MKRTALILPLVAMLAACAGDGGKPAASLPLPAQWQAAVPGARAADPAWWHGYGDPVLDGLVEAALKDSPRIDQAEARIAQARAMARRAFADQLPVAQGNGQIARAEQSTVAGLGNLTRYLPTYSRTQNDAALNVAGSWELDFARGLARRAGAARADAMGAMAGARAVRLAVAAEVVDAYLGWRGAQGDLAQAEARAAALADQRGIAEARLRAGEGAAQAAEQARARAEGAQAGLAQARAALGAARVRLVVLTGQPVGSPVPALDQSAPVPLAPVPGAGEPVDLLRARPDLAVAEADLAGAHARIGAALAEYWPHITLNGLIGWDSGDLGAFTSPASRITQGAVGLRWRLFDFARVNAEVAAARGREREALAAYREAVLQAGGQVESAYLQLGAAREAFADQQAALAAANRAHASATAAFRAGEISRDALRGADLARIEVEQGALQSRLALARAVLACHRALGH
ncbi:MAG: TolC family protein [Proteobacteria bacterium]|nr:TolC family protein [Pseudomonadota bacterium]